MLSEFNGLCIANETVNGSAPHRQFGEYFLWSTTFWYFLPKFENYNSKLDLSYRYPYSSVFTGLLCQYYSMQKIHKYWIKRMGSFYFQNILSDFKWPKLYLKPKVEVIIFRTQYKLRQMSNWLDGSLTMGGKNTQDCCLSDFRQATWLHYAAGFPEGSPWHEDKINGKL